MYGGVNPGLQIADGLSQGLETADQDLPRMPVFPDNGEFEILLRIAHNPFLIIIGLNRHRNLVQGIGKGRKVVFQMFMADLFGQAVYQPLVILDTG